MKISSLSCQYKEHALGIDEKKPVFCYKIESDKKGVMQESFRIVVSSSRENIKCGNFDMWDSGIVLSDSSINITYAGKKLQSCTRYFFLVFVELNCNQTNEKKLIYSDISWFETAFMSRSELSGHSNWIQNKELDFSKPIKVGSYEEGASCPYFRKNFTVKKEIKRARLYISALGLYKASLNGRPFCDDVLSPGWSEYDNILHYQTYDITKSLVDGENAIGLIVADGWYSGCIGLFGRGYYGTTRSCNARILLDYEDGEREFIESDTSWKTSSGAYIYADLLLGEKYDATKEIVGWDSSSFDDSSWENVKFLSEDYISNFQGDFKAQVSPPMRVHERVAPISVSRIDDKTQIIDFGQNLAGWVRLQMNCKKGTEIVIRHGEILTDDGLLYTENLRNAKATDTYICKGVTNEVYEPSFTFHGFRYAEVSGLAYDLVLKDIEACVVYSSNEWTGSFECDSTLVNQLYSNVLWGQRSNFLDVPTDCPQRDERAGWTGDTQVFTKTACYNSFAINFYKKWVTDAGYAQRLDGSYTDVVPYINIARASLTNTSDSGSPAWADAGIIVPYTTYLMYGDTAILEDNYHSMKKFIAFLENECDEFVRGDVGFGDWLSIGEETPREVPATAFVAYSASLMEKIATILGYDKDAAEYKNLAENVKKAFNKTFVNVETGEIHGNTQTCYLIALKFGLIEDALKAKIVENLKKKIIENGNRLSTGFIGVSYLLPMLSEYGLDDLAYTLLLQEKYPSWLYSVVNGATTIWERWNSYTKEQGLGDASMNSFNHYSYGSVAEWMYEYLGGIRPNLENPAFKTFCIKPQLDPARRMKTAKVRYNSIQGLITNEWKIDDECFSMSFEVPCNTECTVYVPKLRMGISVEEVQVSDVHSLSFVEETKDFFVFSCLSGSYIIAY